MKICEICIHGYCLYDLKFICGNFKSKYNGINNVDVIKECEFYEKFGGGFKKRYDWRWRK